MNIFSSSPTVASKPIRRPVGPSSTSQQCARNLCYVGLDGQIRDRIELDDHHRKNSIRHLAISPDDTVAFAMQWQGDMTEDLPLLGVHNLVAGTIGFAEGASVHLMNGYLGSVAISADGRALATTSPRSGVLQIFHNRILMATNLLADVCGVEAMATGFFVTTGTGLVIPPSGNELVHPISWDNHLIAI